MLLPRPFDVRECQHKGRGIYAVVPIEAGALIESAPVLVLSAQDRAMVAETRLRHYYFHWSGDEDGEWSAALALEVQDGGDVVFHGGPFEGRDDAGDTLIDRVEFHGPLQLYSN